jgi:hypothetical protein
MWLSAHRGKREIVRWIGVRANGLTETLLPRALPPAGCAAPGGAAAEDGVLR